MGGAVRDGALGRPVDPRIDLNATACGNCSATGTSCFVRTPLSLRTAALTAVQDDRTQVDEMTGQQRAALQRTDVPVLLDDELQVRMNRILDERDGLCESGDDVPAARSRSRHT